MTYDQLQFIDKVKTNKVAFGNKVIALANELHTDPNYIMAAMDVESSINPKAVNKITGATGLIQFMPKTAIGLGTTTAELYNMSNIEQLDYVRAYLLPFKGKLNQLSDVYLSIFYPAAVGKSSYTFSEKVAMQNPTFAKYMVNGILTKDSIENYLKNRYPQFIEVIKKNAAPITVSVVLLFLIAIFILNK